MPINKIQKDFSVVKQSLDSDVDWDFDHLDVKELSLKVNDMEGFLKEKIIWLGLIENQIILETAILRKYWNISLRELQDIYWETAIEIGHLMRDINSFISELNDWEEPNYLDGIRPLLIKHFWKMLRNFEEMRGLVSNSKKGDSTD